MYTDFEKVEFHWYRQNLNEKIIYKISYFGLKNKYLYCKGPGPVGRRVDILVGYGTGHGTGAGTLEGLGVQEVR